MDGGDYNIPFAFLKKHGDNNCKKKSCAAYVISAIREKVMKQILSFK